jgi:hypothetical protein
MRSFALSLAIIFGGTFPGRSMVISQSPDAHTRIKQWLDKAVVGFNLCPYAKDAVDSNTVRIAHCHSENPEEIIDALLNEAALLLDGDAFASPEESTPPATTSIVVATQIPNTDEGLAVWLGIDEWFQNFLDEDEKEEDPEEQLFAGELSCAFFHPSWKFNDAAEEDPVNFERRSPFPLVSLLKKSEIKTLVDEGLSRGVSISEEIHIRNRNKLRSLGNEKLTEIYNNFR